jgi:hypothetical protein
LFEASEFSIKCMGRAGKIRRRYGIAAMLIGEVIEMV